LSIVSKNLYLQPNSDALQPTKKQGKKEEKADYWFKIVRHLLKENDAVSQSN